MRRYNVHVCLYNPGATWPCSIPSDEHFSGPTVHSQACDIHLKPSDLPGRPIGEYWCSRLSASASCARLSVLWVETSVRFCLKDVAVTGGTQSPWW